MVDFKAKFANRNKDTLDAYSKEHDKPFVDRVKLGAAKLSFSTQIRMDFYDNLAAKVDDGLGLEDIVESLGKRHRIYGDIHEVRFAAWLVRLQAGDDLAGMLDGWIPETEHMLIQIGSMGDLSQTLRLCIKSSKVSQDIRKKVVSAVMSPLMKLLMLASMLYGFYSGMIPMLLEMLPVTEWRGFAQIFYYFLVFVDHYFLLVFAAVAGVTYGIFLTLGGIPRSVFRAILDKIPPWSIYKMQAAANVAVSIATSLQLGVSFPETLNRMLKTIKAPWLRSHLLEMERRTSRGYNIGFAMDTGITPREELGVSDGRGLLDKEILNDLADFSTSSSFDKMMMKIGDKVVEKALKNMDIISGIIGMMITVVVMFGIILMVATFMLTILDFRNSLKT